VTRPGALVLGGDYRGLGIVRSLGRHGIEVEVVHGGETLAAKSRYCRRALRWDGEFDRSYVDFLLRIADEHHLSGWVLFPTSDETAWVVSRNWAELSERYQLTTPQWETYAAASDKRTAHALASSLGLDTPRTWFPRDAAELDELDLEFPLVLKPTRRESINPFTFDKAWRVDGPAELQRRYAAAVRYVPPEQIMIQEWIPGDGDGQYAFAAVCSRGEPRLFVTARRARQYPRDFGRASTYVETVEHPGVAKDATRLLQELGMDGLVEVEFKQDAHRGTLKLLDVNVRVWGWHSIGAAAGVDFAYAAFCLALGADLPVRRGAEGVRWVRLSVDVPYALRDVVAGRLRLPDYLRTLRWPLEGPVAAGDDLRPAIAELPLLIRTLARHRRDRVTRP
jgi:D-aspartate ligase